MKVKEAIRYLQGMNEDEEIIIAWWDKDCFPDLTEEEWEEHSHVIGQRMDWSRAHETMEEMIRIAKEE